MTVRVTPPMLAAYNHFIAVGFVENGAGAAVGNFCQESGELLVTTMFRAHPDYSGGVPEAQKSGGIAEWLGDRKVGPAGEIAFTERAETRLGLPKGSLLNDLGTQCDFVVYELQTNPRYALLYEQLTKSTRSIANLTANFMAIYEAPALATANLDNRIAHAEAVVARAKELKAASQAQAATQTPVPPPAAATAQPITPAQEAPAAPPISATMASLDAAILDHFVQIHAALVKQRAALDLRIAKAADLASDFATLEGLLQQPPATLQKPDAAPATATITQGIKQMVNWKTTLSALVAAAGGIATQFPQFAPYAQAVSAIGTLALGFFAKDANVTGGTVSAIDGTKVGTPVSLIKPQ